MNEVSPQSAGAVGRSKPFAFLIVGILAFVVMAFIGVRLLVMTKSTNEPSDTQGVVTSSISAPTASASPETTNVSSYSLAEVAKHATATDCWMAIEGNVYDVTTFIPTHPGGQAILQGCGKDATQLFNNRPGEGDSHSPRARTLMKDYLIGTLAQ